MRGLHGERTDLLLRRRCAIEHSGSVQQFADALSQGDVLGVGGGEALRGEDDERALVLHGLDAHGCGQGLHAA